MAAGTVTVLGPYTFDATSMTAANTAIGTAYTHANDKWIPLVSANGLNWHVILVSGA